MVFTIAAFYAVNLEEFLEKGTVLFYKPRNYATSVLLMCMPSCCLMVKKSNLHLIGMGLMYCAMIFSGSRSGLLFGRRIVGHQAAPPSLTFLGFL